ncbi:hypothetical protein QWA68_016579 [Fusarium oxysporum]|nr:hypothetical protein QWA68_016579 [Fusarium oxysporum]
MTFRSVFVLGAISVLSMVASSNAATAATTADVAATALPSLVDSLPSCATKCFATVGGEIDCNTTDLK